MHYPRERTRSRPAALFLATVAAFAFQSLSAASQQQGQPTATPVVPVDEAAQPAAPAPVPAALDARWAGAWIGEISAPTVPTRPAVGFPLSLVVRQQADPAAPPLIEMTIVSAGAVGKPAIDVVVDGASVGFTFDGGVTRARFAARVADDGRTAAGSCMFFKESGEAMPPALDLKLRRIDLVSALADQRVYAATLDAAGQRLDMRLALGEGAFGLTGGFEIASQGLRDLPSEVEKTPTGYRVKIPVGTTVVLELGASADGMVLEGTFTQGAFTAPIKFVLKPGERLGSQRRPQDPVPPYPYEERDVRIQHAAGHILSGTLSIPAASPLAREGRVPAVVLVSGSGPQDRDESLVGHRPFLVIADALVRAGVAVLRYDDRGVSRSTGDFTTATTLDFASDADEAVEWLKSHPSVDPSRIGLVGHSEGGLIAPIVAMWQNRGDAPKDPVAFMVLLAGTAEAGGKVLTRQSKALYDAAGVPAEKSGPALAAHAAAMTAVAAGKSGAELRPYIEEMVRKQVAIAAPQVPDDAVLKPTFDAAAAQLASPWMSEFIRFDPRGVLSVIEVPTLAMCGSKDLQVDMATNLGILDEVAKASGAPIETRRLDGLNHLFQPATAGVVEEYGAIDTTFEPKALADMVAWIVEVAVAGPTPQIPDVKRPAGWTTPSPELLPEEPVARSAPKSAPPTPTRRGAGSAARPSSGGTP